MGPSGFSQNLYYEVHGKYTRPIHKEKLSNATTLSDMIPYYPAAWIDSFSSVEVSTVSNGTPMSVPGDNEVLNEYQKDILRSADLGSNIVINILYKTENSATKKQMARILHYDVTVVPEFEAVYMAGSSELTEYLKVNAIDKISAATSKNFTQAIVSFTANDDGKIAEAILSKSSGDKSTDKLLLKTINKIPKWKPAETADGTKVKQAFEFSVNGKSTGC
jgi:TonB family protein